MKKISTVIVLLLILGVLSGCSNDMLMNSETGNYGPAWDVTTKLPAISSNNTIGDMVDLQGFSDFGFKVIDSDGDGKGDDISFTVVGSNQKPIGRTFEYQLQPLEVERTEPFVSESTDKFSVAGNETLPEIEIPFPLDGFVFGESSDSTYNKLNISVENTGANILETLNITVKTGNGDVLKNLSYINISAGTTSDEQSIDFNGKEIDYSNLILEVSFEQDELNPTEAIINFSGFTNLKIVKANNIDGEVLSDFSFNETIELGDALAINAYDYTGDGNDDNAEFRFDITVPGAEGLNFDFSSTTLDGVGVNYASDKEDYFIESGTSISFGELNLVSSITAENENGTFSYDATKNMEVGINMLGQVQFDNPAGNEELPFEIEGNDLVYEMEAMPVDITQDDIDKMRNNIDSEKNYLKTEILNSLPVGLKADIYIANTDDPELLYDEEEKNKVNENSVVNISGSNDGSTVSSENKFILSDTIDKLEDMLTEGEVYIGFRFVLGDLEDDELDDEGGVREYNFKDTQTIDTKAHIGVTVKVNQ